MAHLLHVRYVSVCVFQRFRTLSLSQPQSVSNLTLLSPSLLPACRQLIINTLGAVVYCLVVAGQNILFLNQSDCFVMSLCERRNVFVINTTFFFLLYKEINFYVRYYKKHFSSSYLMQVLLIQNRYVLVQLFTYNTNIAALTIDRYQY